MNSIWDQVLARVETKINRHSFYTWFKPTTFVRDEGTTLRVRVPNGLFSDWLTKHYTGILAEALADIGRPQVAVVFVTDDPAEAPPTLTPAEASLAPPTPPPSPDVELVAHGGLNPRYTFDTFVVGSSNQFAHAACRAVAEAPGRSYNPLFIYGGVGLGKTHLLHAIGHRCRQDGYRVRYISAETFTNDLVMAIRTKQTPEFRERYRTVDVLLIDDIQFISGKEGTQDEFFHTFDDLHSYGKQVIISSDRSPKSLAALEERLLSRFEWGLTADVQPPDEETRRAILLAKAEDLNCYVPDNVIEFIAHNSRQNIRELEGALNKVMAYANLTSRPIDLELVNMALADTMRRPERISVEQIIDIVCRYYNVTADALISSSRKSTIAYPRQVAMYLARTETDASLPQIGAQMGPRDHTTVLHGSEKIKTLVDTDPQLRRDLLEIKAMLYERAAVITH